MLSKSKYNKFLYCKTIQEPLMLMYIVNLQEGKIVCITFQTYLAMKIFFFMSY